MPFAWLLLAFPWSQAASGAETCFITELAPHPTSLDDWIAQAEPREMEVHPEAGAILRHNPPIFRWPSLDGVSGYEFKLSASGSSHLEETANNWLFLDKPLAPGRYGWQVRAKKGSVATSAWSAPRRFVVPEDTVHSPIPDFPALLDRARRTPHPRAVPQGKGWTALVDSLRNGVRQGPFAAFLRNVEMSAGRRLTIDPNEGAEDDEGDEDSDDGTLEKGSAGGKRDDDKKAKRIAYAEAGRTVDAAYAWRTTRDDRFRKEAVRRALGLAAWGAHGLTDGAEDDLASQRIAYSLALSYDLLHDLLSEDERAALRDAIAVRTEQLLDRYVRDPTRGLAHKPQNSHGFRDVGAIAAIAVLLAGDLPAADNWYRESLPLYLAILSPWGGDDGGFANGTNYAVSDLINHMGYWDVIRNAAGFDIARLPWPQAVGHFLFTALPPGAPANLFGDGADAAHYFPERWMRAAALYAQRVPTSLSRRYADGWGGPAPVDRLYLFAPADGADASAGNAEPCDSAFFPSIGWTAMHSDLGDPKRTSVYFKASPYGSLNHSHADQNSFVIDAGGARLAIDSGYYDSYRSRHRKDWTAQTMAHNAITFDGGQGQKIQSKAATGRIEYYSHTPAMDVVVGDATIAYGRALKAARRTLVYLRPDTILVYDRLESNQPRRWEWNIHSLTRFAEEKPSIIRTGSGSASLCLSLLEGPETQFTQTDAFTEPPKGKRKEYPNQWHGRFTAAEASTNAEFLVLLSVGCGARTVSHAPAAEGQGFAVAIDGTRVVINGEGAVLQ